MAKRNKLRKRQGDPYDEDTGTSDEERGNFVIGDGKSSFERRN